MPTTRSADEKLNKFVRINTSGEHAGKYSDIVAVITGNIKDTKGKIVNNKYVSGRVFNDTYTLLDNEEGAILTNYYDAFTVTGAVLDSSLVSDRWYSVYGQPNKWIYDTRQKFSNCGVDSCLNILSIAGIKDIVEPTAEDIAGSVSDTSTTTGSSDDSTTTTTTDTSSISYVSTEEEFTLWAIRNNYCDHWGDDYTSVKDILPEDGETYFSTQGGEEHTYHESLAPISTILEANGLESDIIDLSVRKTLANAETKTFEDRNAHAEESTPSNDEYEIKSSYGDCVVISKDGADTIYFSDLSQADLQDAKIVKKDNDLYLVYTPGYSVKLQDFYPDPTGSNANSLCHVTTLKFRDNSTVSLGNWLSGRYELPAEYLDTNLYKYGTFAEELMPAVAAGKGVLLSGLGQALNGSLTPAMQNIPGLLVPNHIISLVGVVMTEFSQAGINDVAGFYVVDTGGFLPAADGAQFVTVATLHEFLTCTNKVKNEWDDPYFDTKYVATKENLKTWADDLNLVGNDRKNNLEGNEGNNIIKGKGGKDLLFGEGGNDTLYGGTQNDTLYGGVGDNILYGESGNDSYVFNKNRESSDIVIPGTGKDLLRFETVNKEDLKFGNVNGSLHVSYVKELEYHDDEEVGTSDFHFISRDSGNISITSLDEYDRIVFLDLSKQDLDDAILVRKGNDLYIAYTNDSTVKIKDYYAGSHVKYISFSALDEQNIEISDWVAEHEVLSEEFFDTIYHEHVGSVTVKDYFSKSLYDSIVKLDDKSTIAQTADNDEEWGKYAYNFYKDILKKVPLYYDKYVDNTRDNNIIGTKFKDSIVASDYHDTITAGDSMDSINGGAGNDVIYAGTDNDIIYGSHGNDKIYGDTGRNRIIYEGAFSGNDTIFAGKGEDHIEMSSKTRDDLAFVQSGKDLVIVYDENDGSSITVQNYFAKKGNTSVKDMLLSTSGGNYDYLDLVREYSDISSALVQNKNGQDSVGGAGYDTLVGSDGSDSIFGGLGNDVIKSGNGNDTLNGGVGNDQLYGGSGDNTFVFSSLKDGMDTIYAAGGGQINLDFSSLSDISLNTDKSGLVDAFKDYAFVKLGNDLIFDYSKDAASYGMSNIVLKNYFKSKNVYNMITADGATTNLSDVLVCYQGKADKANKITGTKQGDMIIGGLKNDKIKGGLGNDIIVGGAGNDVITGGVGSNTVVYNIGDGKDTINLTKLENLKIAIKGDNIISSDLSYRIEKNNLLISCKGDDILVLKNFAKKDVTTESGSVDLYLNDVKIHDLRKDLYLPAYEGFSSKKYKYNGNWHSEVINASDLISATNKKGRGVLINANAGNDVILGSDYNDTLRGGDGNDVICGLYGNNTYEGGEGSDVYKLFVEGNDANDVENAIIKDTGYGADDVDIVDIAKNSGDLNIWFNIDRSGNSTNIFNISGKEDLNTATLYGIETIKTKDDYVYNYEDSSLKEAVVGWLSSHSNYMDVNDVMQNGYKNDQEALLAYFASGWSAPAP